MRYQSSKQGHRKNVPLFVKIIILAQSATILLFTIGMYQEYLSNTYLQNYVVGILSSNLLADAMLSVVTMSVFALGTFTLLGSMGTSRRASKDWQLMSESARESLDMPTMPVLDVVEPSLKQQRAKPRTRRRKPAIDTEELFRSMTSYADSRKE